MSFMKTFILLTTLFSLTCAHAFFRGGSMGSGGGGSIVCRDQFGNINSAQVLDIYEAIHVHELEIKKPLSNLTDEYHRYLTSYNKMMGHQLPGYDHSLLAVASYMELFIFLPLGEKLKSSNDFGELEFTPPKGCKLEQLAIYDIQGHEVYINSEIWEALDITNKAALIAHEELYTFHRHGIGATDSKATRKLVGELFAE
jgi:hypothetical protein